MPEILDRSLAPGLDPNAQVTTNNLPAILSKRNPDYWLAQGIGSDADASLAIQAAIDQAVAEGALGIVPTPGKVYKIPYKTLIAEFDPLLAYNNNDRVKNAISRRVYRNTSGSTKAPGGTIPSHTTLNQTVNGWLCESIAPLQFVGTNYQGIGVEGSIKFEYIESSISTSLGLFVGGIEFGDGFYCSDLTIDGRRDQAHAATDSTLQAANKVIASVMIFPCRPQTRGAKFRNVSLKNHWQYPATGAIEGFGLSLQNTISSEVDNLVIENFDGTGLHLDGDMIKGTPCQDFKVRGIKARNSKVWQLYSCFYALNGEITNTNLIGADAGAGGNYEHCEGIITTNLYAKDCKRAGIQLLGNIVNCSFINPVIENCGDPNDTFNTAAIVALPGSWFRGADQIDGVRSFLPKAYGWAGNFTYQNVGNTILTTIPSHTTLNQIVGGWLCAWSNNPWSANMQVTFGQLITSGYRYFSVLNHPAFSASSSYPTGRTAYNPATGFVYQSTANISSGGAAPSHTTLGTTVNNWLCLTPYIYANYDPANVVAPNGCFYSQESNVLYQNTSGAAITGALSPSPSHTTLGTTVGSWLALRNNYSFLLGTTQPSQNNTTHPPGAFWVDPTTYTLLQVGENYQRPPRGGTRSVEIIGGKIEPASGCAHLRIKNDSNINIGSGQAIDKFKIQVPGCYDWSIFAQIANPDGTVDTGTSLLGLTLDDSNASLNKISTQGLPSLNATGNLNRTLNNIPVFSSLAAYAANSLTRSGNYIYQNTSGSTIAAGGAAPSHTTIDQVVSGWTCLTPAVDWAQQTNLEAVNLVFKGANRGLQFGVRGSEGQIAPFRYKLRAKFRPTAAGLIRSEIEGKLFETLNTFFPQVFSPEAGLINPTLGDLNKEYMMDFVFSPGSGTAKYKAQDWGYHLFSKSAQQAGLSVDTWVLYQIADDNNQARLISSNNIEEVRFLPKGVGPGNNVIYKKGDKFRSTDPSAAYSNSGYDVITGGAFSVRTYSNNQPCKAGDIITNNSTQRFLAINDGVTASSGSGPSFSSGLQSDGTVTFLAYGSIGNPFPVASGSLGSFVEIGQAFVNLHTAGTTTIATTQSNRFASIGFIDVRTVGASLGVINPATVSLGMNSSSFDNVISATSLTGLLSNNQKFRLNPVSPCPVSISGNTITLNNSVAASGKAITIGQTFANNEYGTNNGNVYQNVLGSSRMITGVGDIPTHTSGTVNSWAYSSAFSLQARVYVYGLLN